MADIRLVRPRVERLWLWIGVLAVVALLFWASAFVFGDATDPTEQPRVGAAAGFGAERAPVLPAQTVPLETLIPLQTRDLGRLVRLTGVAESRVASNAVWIRSSGGRRILVRFQPPPPEGALSGLGPGSAVSFDGYLQKISRAEFKEWVDTLNIAVPRPPPGRKFGDLPDPAFMRVDSLFVRDFYISVRPEGIEPEDRAGSSAT